MKITLGRNQFIRDISNFRILASGKSPQYAQKWQCLPRAQKRSTPGQSRAHGKNLLYEEFHTAETQVLDATPVVPKDGPLVSVAPSLQSDRLNTTDNVWRPAPVFDVDDDVVIWTSTKVLDQEITQTDQKTEVQAKTSERFPGDQSPNADWAGKIPDDLNTAKHGTMGKGGHEGNKENQRTDRGTDNRINGSEYSTGKYSLDAMNSSSEEQDGRQTEEKETNQE